MDKKERSKFIVVGNEFIRIDKILHFKHEKKYYYNGHASYCLDFLLEGGYKLDIKAKSVDEYNDVIDQLYQFANDESVF